jgi:hypothetical protein
VRTATSEGSERAGRPLTRQRLEAALREAPFDLGGYRVSYADDRNAASNHVEISVIGPEGKILN